MKRLMLVSCFLFGLAFGLVVSLRLARVPAEVRASGLTAGTPVSGMAADGSTAAGNPVLIAGHDTAVPQVAHTLQVDTFGDLVLSGLSAVQGDGSSNTPTIPGLGTSGSPVPSTWRVFPFRFNGSTWDRQYLCNQRAAFNLASSGDTQVIAASGSTVIRVCFLSFSTGAAEDIQLDQGTGSNCGSSTAALTGLYKAVLSQTWQFGPDSALRTAAGQALCVNQSNGQALGGVVVYAQF